MFDLSQDVPNFNLPPNPPAPGGNHPWTGSPLANGAAIQYDATRQVRAVLKSSDSGLLNSEHSVAPDILNYPTDISEGNDGPNMNLELMPYQNPTGSQAVMRDTDDPRYTLSHGNGLADATFLLQAQFRQYARVQIAGKWYQCSDPELSDLKFKFRKTGGMWIDDGSSFVTGNGPFPPQ